MEDAFFKFLLEAGNTRTTESVIRHLRDASAIQNYGGENRNRVVEALAADVEAEVGTAEADSVSAMFRTTGPLHDALQELMDAFWDFVDDVS